MSVMHYRCRADGCDYRFGGWRHGTGRESMASPPPLAQSGVSGMNIDYVHTELRAALEFLERSSEIAAEAVIGFPALDEKLAHRFPTMARSCCGSGIPANTLTSLCSSR